MKKPCNVFEGIIHWASVDTIYGSNGKKMYSSVDGGKTWEKEITIPVSMWNTLRSSLRKSRRLFRSHIYHILPSQAGRIIVCGFKNLFCVDPDSGQICSTNSLVGSRPLTICSAGGKICYGEYRGNPERSNVSVWCSDDDGVHWSQIQNLKGCRHIHGVFWDPYSHDFWVTTGDEDEESGIWVTRDKFMTLEKVIGDSQQARVIQLLFTPNYVYFGTDTPSEANFICRMPRAGGKITHLQEVENSIFHGTKVGQYLFFSTACDPSPINTTDKAVVWWSKDGERWERFIEFKKDHWPAKLFQYGQIMFPAGPGDGRHLWLTPFSCHHDQVSFCYDLASC